MPSQVLTPTPWAESRRLTDIPGDEVERFVGQPRSLTDPALIADVDATIEQIGRILERVKVPSAGDERNLALLVRLVAAWLEGLSAKQVAGLLGYSEDSLAKILQGKRRVQASKADRVLVVAEVTRLLGEILQAEAVGRWFNTYVPALKSTPLEAVKKRRSGDVLKVVKAYSSPSYS